MIIQNIYNTPNINCLQIILDEVICKGIYYSENNSIETPRTIKLIKENFSEIESITIVENKIIICSKGLSKIENKVWIKELISLIENRLPIYIDSNVENEYNEKYTLELLIDKANEDGGCFSISNGEVLLYGACRGCIGSKELVKQIEKKIGAKRFK